MNNKAETTAIDEANLERRGPNRTREDADWESKVLGRVSGHLRSLEGEAEAPQLGWEAAVLDTLRQRIERGPK